MTRSAACLGAVLLTASMWATGARADVLRAQPPPAADREVAASPAEPRHRTWGMLMDVGLPDGAAIGLAFRPRFDWLRFGVAATHNALAPGVRVGVTLDPVAFPIGPTLTVEGGHYWNGTVPFVNGSPSIGYDYANIHLGLEFGKRAAFRFYLRGGLSWLDLRSVQSQDPSASGLRNPSYTGWLAPSAKLGFSLCF